MRTRITTRVDKAQGALASMGYGSLLVEASAGSERVGRRGGVLAGSHGIKGMSMGCDYTPYRKVGKPWTVADVREQLPMVHVRHGDQSFLATVTGRRLPFAVVRVRRPAVLQGEGFYSLGEIIDDGQSWEFAWQTIANALNNCTELVA
jgi:hypothetical protein